jgi:predicted AlkP superfamily phosphohydrolase/phosphomutase
MKPPKEKKGPFENLSSFRMGKRRFSLSMADVDWTKTKAYAKTGMGQIVINVQGRESHGCVQPGQDYEEVQQEIIKKLSNLVDPETGQSIKGDLYRREDVYKGPFLESAPDIVFIPMNNRYLTTNLTGFYSQKVFNDVSVFYGNHTMEGLFIASGPKMKKGVEIVGANIIDLAPTILFAMGIPILDSMDGKVLSDIFKSEFLKKNPIKFQKETDETGRNQIGLNHLDQEEALERLKDLGYI